jgi:hypothetical protein
MRAPVGSRCTAIARHSRVPVSTIVGYFSVCPFAQRILYRMILLSS